MEIIANKVSKKVGSRTILGNISLHIKSGSIYGLIGPNGAGKTTFARLLINIYTPTSGSQFSFFRKYNPIIYKMYHNRKNDKSPIEQKENPEKAIFIKPNFQDGLLCKKLSDIINKNKHKEYLIIDLRHSTGGNVKNCEAICNMLLPKCDIFTQNFKNKTVIYTSDENNFKFKKVFVLVDRYTASSSEILAYSIKTHLKNCVLIGEPTYGKTIGQDIITNKNHGVILSIISFTWCIDDFSYENVEIIKPYSGSDSFDTVIAEIKNHHIY